MHVIPHILIPQPTSFDVNYNERCWGQYAAAVQAAGGHPVPIPTCSTGAQALALARSCHGIILPGSPADVDPQRYGQEPTASCARSDVWREQIDIELLEEARIASKPILGICFGVQSLNVWSGGTLLQDLNPVPVNHSAGASVAVAHTVLVAEQSAVWGTLGEIPGECHSGLRSLQVNSSHHQAVGIVGNGLVVTARCSEDGVVEAVEQKGGPFMVGVQWHPERSAGTDRASQNLFRALVEASAGI